MKKLFFAATAVLCCVALLSSCAVFENKYALEVNGAQVSSSVFSYFLDQIVSNSETPLSKEDAVKQAITLTSEYIAVNTKFLEMKTFLSTSEKSSVSKNTNDFWRLYSSYYENIDVDKHTLYKIESYKAYQNALMMKYYDKGGIEAVEEKTLIEYFTANYVAFRAINGYLTTVNENGETVKLSDEKIKELQNTFQNVANKVNANESTFDTANAIYLESQGSVAPEVAPTSVIKKGDVNYPEGFFDAVHKMSYDKVEVLTLGDYIFVIEKVDMTQDDEAYYFAYRANCLTAMKSNDFKELVSSWVQNYTITQNTRQIDRIWKAISKNTVK